jgi:hypothetical protein
MRPDRHGGRLGGEGASDGSGEGPGRERVGPFPSWGWVYGTLIVYGVLMLGLLTVLTWVLDPGTTP